MSDIKQELKTIKYLDFKIEHNLQELQNLKLYQDILKGIDYSLEKIQSSNRMDISDTIIKIVDLETQINDDIKRLLDKKELLKAKIDTLKPLMYQVMYLRYFKYYSWSVVAKELYYCEEYVRKIHGIALEILRKNEKEFTKKC